ncbi:MAG: hypothetical protein KF886_01865 [Candidatus Hydrogenedentes bacterium]|nr:hypothetical protein [Candidatus Hydrogenedentota bacterium]
MFNHATNFALGVILALLATAAPKAPAEDAVQIAISGFFVSAEEIEPGDDWWGIFPSGNGFYLHSTSVTTEAVVNPIDGDGVRKTATKIKTSRAGEQILLVRGLRDAAPGPLIALKPAFAATNLKPGMRSTFSIKQLSQPVLTELFGTGHVVLEPGERYTRIRDYELHLMELPGRTSMHQVIIQIPTLDGEAAPTLVWAGDLDRDGKLDLLMNLSASYMHTDLALLLSSAAKEGERVGLVARWNARSGC